VMSVETCVFFKVTPMNFSLFHVVAIWHNLRAILKKPKIDLKNNFLTIFFQTTGFQNCARVAQNCARVAQNCARVAPHYFAFFPI